MNGLAIVNPLRKRKRKSSTRRKSSTKRRRNPIANLGSFAKRRSSSSRRRRSTKRRASSVSVPSRSAPVRRRRRSRSSGGGIVRRVGGTVSRGIGGFASSVMPAAIGAVGALGIDLAWGYLPIPPGLKSGPLAPVTRAVAAVGLGMLAGAIVNKKFGREVMLGGMIVTGFDVVKGIVKNNTSLPLSYYAQPRLPGGRGMGYYAYGGGDPYQSDRFIDPEGYATDVLQYGGF